MPTITNYRRIGIECELRKLCFNKLTTAGGPRNKTILAASATKGNVSDDPYDTHPWVKAVMEGQDSHTEIIELVFGPLTDTLLRDVVTVADIASKIDLKAVREVSGKRSAITFADWVATFNNKLKPAFQNFRMIADTRFANLSMKALTATSGSPSRQVNLTIPIGARDSSPATPNRRNVQTHGHHVLMHRTNPD